MSHARKKRKLAPDESTHLKCLLARDGTRWTEKEKSKTGRRSAHNILHEKPGPSSYVKRHFEEGNHASIWSLINMANILCVFFEMEIII